MIRLISSARAVAAAFSLCNLQLLHKIYRRLKPAATLFMVVILFMVFLNYSAMLKSKICK